MHWVQIYNPTGNMFLSFIVALIPILYFFWALAIRKMKGYIAGLTTVLIAVIETIVVYGMPTKLAITATIYGGLEGLWPIGWIIVTVVFLYKLTVRAGQFDIIKNSIAMLTDDRRLQALLIAFSFGAFLEGAAGFGAPVAIAGAILTGLGFNPFFAAGLCLIADTAPVAFGGVGIPITTSASVTGLDPLTISAIVGRQLPILSLFIPFWLVFIMSGWKKTIEVLPAILVTGVSFAATQFFTSNYMGPQLPDIASAIVSLVVLAIFLKFWKPKTIFRFENERESEKGKMVGQGMAEQAAALDMGKVYTSGQIFKAWSPFIVLIVFIAAWGGIPAFKAILDKASITFNVPFLNNAVEKAQPIVSHLTPYAAIFKWDILAETGTSILGAAIVSKFILQLSWRAWMETFGEALKELALPLVMIVAVLGFAYIENYSGMSATLGLGLASTGKVFPFLAPLLGWVGVFLTGSDTSSNALFSNLQKITGHQIGVNPSLLVAANSTGGVMGKMISPQSIAVATAATGQIGEEGNLFQFTFKHSLLFVGIAGIITLLQAYVFSWMLP